MLHVRSRPWVVSGEVKLVQRVGVSTNEVDDMTKLRAAFAAKAGPHTRATGLAPSCFSILPKASIP